MSLGVPVWQAGDSELLAELRAMETRMHSLWAEMLSVVAEVDSRGIAGKEGYGTTVQLIRALCRVPRSEARARLSAAGDVLPSRGLNGAALPPPLPVTAAAVAEGMIGAADVAVIRSVLARIPANVGEEQRAQVEAELAHHARTLDAGQLAVLGRRTLAYLDQDGPAPKDQPETRRWLRFTDRDGGVELSGWLDREAAEIVRSALSPLAAPRPATSADALVNTPTTGTGTGTPADAGTGTPAAAGTGAGGEPDLRDAAQRDADALVELAQRALGSGALPSEGGERPQVVVTVPLVVLQGRIGTASLAFGGPINADAARRIACDARLIPAVLGARGEPLDVGRASYTVPVAIRRAVILRDGGCAFPGCSVPARWCECHHVRHWADGGPTSLDNCVLLCGRHHHLLHHSSWWIDMGKGVPEFHPPPWIGGPPRRNPLHHPSDLIRRE
ncbi:MAG: DUF222 domain-containing protein [Pseudonocardiaceae bacterium]